MNNGKPIIPRDGTSLLVGGYYFNIEVKTVPLLGDEKESFIIKGDFILEGQLQKDLAVGDSSFLSVTANFKPLSSANVEFN